MFYIQMPNFKMIGMSNVKLFDVRHSNDECQNDLNVECQTVLCLTVKYRCKECKTVSNVECQNDMNVESPTV